MKSNATFLVLFGMTILLMPGTLLAETLTPSIINYSFYGMANGYEESVANAPLYVNEWGWVDVGDGGPANGVATGNIENGSDYFQLNLTTEAIWLGSIVIDFDTTTPSFFSTSTNPLVSEASVEAEALFTVEATETSPVGSPVELSIATTCSGNPDSWHVRVYRNDTLLTNFPSSPLETKIYATVGEALRIEASLEDGVYLDDSTCVSALNVTMHAVSVPEPNMIVLIFLGTTATLMTIRRKRTT